MSVFGAISEQLKAPDGLSWGQINDLWGGLLGGYQARSGVSVSWQTALRASTVLACARVLAEGIAQLPLKILEVGEDGSRTPATAHPVYNLLYRRPNDWMTSFEFRETKMLHAVLAGNAYSFINRVNGKIVELIPIPPNRCTPLQASDYTVTYRVTAPDGSQEVIDASLVWHIKGLSWDGFRGLDTVLLAREAIGLALATEQSHAMLHANGLRSSGLLSVKKTLDDKELTRLSAWVKKNFAGLDNVARVMIGDDDMKFTPFDMKGMDAQHLETRRMQIEEVCRFMRVFPQMVMHTDKTATFASADAFFTAHVVHSLSPWVARWEQSISRSLLADDEALIAKFNINGLLRGDSVSRGDFYLKALGGARAETAFMTRNEVRELEDLDPIEGGDVLPTPIGPQSGQPPIGGPDAGPTKPPTPPGTTQAKVDELLDALLELKFNPNHDERGRFGTGSGGGLGTLRAFLKDKSAKDVLAAVVAKAVTAATDRHNVAKALGAAVTFALYHGLSADMPADVEEAVREQVEHLALNTGATVASAREMMRSGVKGLITLRQAQVTRRSKAADDVDPVLGALQAVADALDNDDLFSED
jgi:HK97 family phage portal protein